jgi:hypothetical protein
VRLASFVAAVVVGLALLACGGLATPPEPAPAPAPEVAPAAEPLLPPLPDRGADRPADCLVDLEDLAPLLALRQPAAPKPARFERRLGAVVERAVLADGTIVRLSRYGCVHYGETWELGPLPEGGDPREFAIERIGQLETRDGRPPIVDMLKRAPGVGPDGTFACGDATCAIEREGALVTITYDFPL